MSNIDYSSRIRKLNSRYNPDNVRLVESRTFSATDSPEEVSKYVLRAMREVDDEYTHITRQAGDAVKQHLNSLLSSVQFEYQGSVMTGTHIKGASDIDLLTICTKFYSSAIFKVREELNRKYYHTAEQNQNLQDYSDSFSEYQGNTYDDLRQLRLNCENILRNKYNDCDTSKSKSIKVTNHHYHRDVDVVVSCWYDSYDYVLNGSAKELRGIKIYNKDLGDAQGPDYPFLGISRINTRSSATNGRLKKMIRFLKNVRTDADINIRLTSFDINSICYAIPVDEYQFLDHKQIVHLLWLNLYRLWNNGTADELKSVVGIEYVFKDHPDKIEHLKALENEVWKIHQDLNRITL